MIVKNGLTIFTVCSLKTQNVYLSFISCIFHYIQVWRYNLVFYFVFCLDIDSRYLYKSQAGLAVCFYFLQSLYFISLLNMNVLGVRIMKIKRRFEKRFVMKILTVLLAVIAFEFILYSSYSQFFSNSGGAAAPNIFQEIDDVPYPYTGTDETVLTSEYNRLETEEMKELYRAIEKSVYCISSSKDSEGRYETLPVFAGNREYTEKEIYSASTAFFDDNPQIFWSDKSIVCSYTSEKGAFVSSYSLYSFESINKMNRQLSMEVLKIVNQAPAVTDHYYVEKFVHDTLVENCEYTVPSEKHGLAATSFGCIVQNQANCEGITDGFNLLMKCLGYETLKIYGYSQGVGLHTWSSIRLGNQWYMTDVTWDLRDSSHRYDYFNISTEEILKTHNIEKTYDKVEEYNISLELANRYFNIYVPECKDLNQSYFARECYAVTKENDVYKNKYLLEYIYKACKSGVDYCSLKISTDLVSVDNIIAKMFSEDNVEYYNTNMEYRLDSGEDFSLDAEKYEFIEALNVLILRF